MTTAITQAETFAESLGPKGAFADDADAPVVAMAIWAASLALRMGKTMELARVLWDFHEKHLIENHRDEAISAAQIFTPEAQTATVAEQRRH